MSFFKKKVIPETFIISQLSLEQRISYSQKILQKYHEVVPVIIKKSCTDKILQDIDKETYLMPKNLNISHILCTIRKKINIDDKQAIFIFVNNTLVPMNVTIGEIYNQHKSDDNFLYIVYKTENTFG
jgi:GABA(A) receptor-associated protein